MLNNFCSRRGQKLTKSHKKNSENLYIYIAPLTVVVAAVLLVGNIPSIHYIHLFCVVGYIHLFCVVGSH